LLLERAGEVVTREDLKQRLWPGEPFIHFEENLNTNLNRLRQALGDSASQQRLIRTLPRQGYRFIAPITWVEESGAALPERPDLAETSASSEEISNSPSQPKRVFPMMLRAVLASALIFVLGLGGLAYYLRFSHSAKAGSGLHHQTILVTPFQNLNGDPSQDYLSDGLTDEMITRLGQIAPQRLSVIARSTAMQYKGAHKSAAEIAREQHVDYILEGSFLRQGSHVRITAQLSDGRDQGSLWTESYERDATDLFGIQREVSDRIAKSLSLELLPPAANPTVTGEPIKPEAYDAYLQGLFELNRATPGNLEKSIGYFRQATEKDGRFAAAYAALAYSYNAAADWTYMSPGEAFPKEKAAANKAIEVDSALSDSHLAMAEVLHEYDWDWAGAEKEYQQALQLNPSSVVAHRLYAEYLTRAGRFPDALTEIRKAQQLDPESLTTSAYLCFINFHARDYESAIKQCREILEIDPHYLPAHDWLADSLTFAKRYDEAIAQYKKAMDESGNASYFLSGLGMVYALKGDQEQARKVLTELSQRAKQSYVSPYELAGIYAGLGDKERALGTLDEAVKEHSSELVYLASAAEFDSLRDDPRFKAMIARIGFPESASSIPTASRLAPSH
jgi:TolB-like protein/DNA-binding winged helix-turn-helix (wHTH) protein/Tfp pilus assembly protein PilF